MPLSNPKLNFLDDLKAVAERAKLDPENLWLHKSARHSQPRAFGLASICVLCSMAEAIERKITDFLSPLLIGQQTAMQSVTNR